MAAWAPAGAVTEAAPFSPGSGSGRGRPAGAAASWTGGTALESTIEFRARYSETDQMGVVYHTNYLVWCEMGRTELMRQLGTSYAELERRGVILAVSEARVSFRASARYDDPIRVRTQLVRLRSRGVTFAYRVEQAETGTLLARAETDLVCLDGQGTPRKLPADVQTKLQSALASASQEGTIDALSGV